MKRVKIGDQVEYATWTIQGRKATVKAIEICKCGEKNGRMVNSCDLDLHQEGTITLNDGHWCYFDQVKQVINK